MKKCIWCIMFVLFLVLSCATQEKIREDLSKDSELFLPLGNPGTTNYGDENFEIFFSFGSDSLLNKIEIPSQKFLEKHEYIEKIRLPKLLGYIPPQFAKIRGSHRYLNLFRCYFDNQIKAWGVGTSNSGIRIFNYAVEAEELSNTEYYILGSLKGLVDLPVNFDDVEKVSIRYSESDFRDATTSMFVKIVLKDDNYVFSTTKPELDSKNSTSSDTLTVGNNIRVPSYWNEIGSVSCKDSLYAESDYWFNKPNWWNIYYSSKSETEINSLLWEDNGSPWANGVYRYYDKSNKTLYLWKWRKQWFTRD